MTRPEQAASYFHDGYNCAQAVAMAYADLLGMEPAQCAKAVSGFGGGFGRLREVCGAVSGMTFVISTLYGYDTPDAEQQMATYALIQELAGKFQAQVGSIICRDILKNPPNDPAPTPRTAEYYAVRPCARMVYLAASLVEEQLANHPLT